VNYATLSSAIQSYTQNYEDNFIANIPLFIKQAEDRIYNSVLLVALRKNVTAFVNEGYQYISCPADFLAVFSLAIYDSTLVADEYVTSNLLGYLLDKDTNFLREAYPYNTNDSTYWGVPKYYSLFGPTIVTDPNGVKTVSADLTFMVAPVPDSSYYIAELHYYYYPDSIVQGFVTSLELTDGGDLYTNGVYYNVPLVGGSGYGARATVIVANGVVTTADLTASGSLYMVGDVLKPSPDFVGGGSIAGGYDATLTVLSINNSNGTSWLGNNYSPVLLYGALVEAYTFMKGEADMMTYYEKKYQEAVQQLIRLGAGLERGDTYRDGQYKGKVAP
jgi:hypothetical protein